jgi:hypothetical protein
VRQEELQNYDTDIASIRRIHLEYVLYTTFLKSVALFVLRVETFGEIHHGFNPNLHADGADGVTIRLLFFGFPKQTHALIHSYHPSFRL